MAVRAVIFDYKTLTGLGPDDTARARNLLYALVDQGIEWVLFSTYPLSHEHQHTIADYPDPAVHFRLVDIASGKARGSPDWIDAVTDALDLARHELLYVGQSMYDWLTAINAGVLYLHALWSTPIPRRVTALAAPSPNDVADFVDDFLTGEPIWSHRLDSGTWALRSLLPASTVLPATNASGRFTLQDVFTYGKRIDVGNDEARDLLMITVLTSAYLEGLIPANPYICVYPSSTPDKVSWQLADYLDKAASLFHGYYREDLLVRGAPATDTSLERWKAQQEHRTPNVSIATQAQTVHVGANYEGKLKGKTVVVFDDFTTHGNSLEWARILLKAAGAAAVVMLTVGKYGNGHTRFELKNPGRLDPYMLSSLSPDDFWESHLSPAFDPMAEPRTRTIFRAAIDHAAD